MELSATIREDYCHRLDSERDREKERRGLEMVGESHEGKTERESDSERACMKENISLTGNQSK